MKRLKHNYNNSNTHGKVVLISIKHRCLKYLRGRVGYVRLVGTPHTPFGDTFFEFKPCNKRFNRVHGTALVTKPFRT